MLVLVINAGSSSVKYQLIDTEGAVLARGTIDRIGEDGRTHDGALAEVLSAVRAHHVEAVGHRVVHGGERFFAAAQAESDLARAKEFYGKALAKAPGDQALKAKHRALAEVGHRISD